MDFASASARIGAALIQGQAPLGSGQDPQTDQDATFTMHLDVQDLRNFYYRNPLGRAAQKVLRDLAVAQWPPAKGQTVVGFGFAVPLLRPYLAPSRRVIALMPGPQGVMPWPQGMANVSVLSDETLWPLTTGIADRLMVLHGLETSNHPDALLDECFRVLGPGGRAIFMVPNRGGLWARSDRTPFGFGHPYSPGQLEGQLKRHGFVIERSQSTLYQPPSSRRFWRRFGPLIEAGGRHLPMFKAGGVLAVEVSKQVFAPRRGLPVGARARIGVLNPVPQAASRAGPGWGDS